MNTSTVLYTPQVLALATSLASYPPDPALPHAGDARSPACGSTLSVQLGTDGMGRITAVGLRTHACAIGQASAAIFAEAAIGRNADDLVSFFQQIEAWLRGDAVLPEWPGLAAIAAAQAYPGRHGAILLPWKAAIAALSSNDPSS
ncbi:iron-sulfur cluster assembly scaffold protein [Novosphingobium sp.]|uniref:iron-sulfur cluster assembly scaffold protein n=1 Tax=Novosphingobium sp. TaxID=1874826 RepID=UPI0025D765EA|nr:iron-sulfur cluster assembly scaffold protein [Novosphingobium sp.]